MRYPNLKLFWSGFFGGLPLMLNFLSDGGCQPHEILHLKQEQSYFRYNYGLNHAVWIF